MVCRVGAGVQGGCWCAGWMLVCRVGAGVQGGIRWTPSIEHNALAARSELPAQPTRIISFAYFPAQVFHDRRGIYEMELCGKITPLCWKATDRRKKYHNINFTALHIRN